MRTGYLFYLGKCLLPVTPKELKVKVTGNNQKVTLINEGDVNVLKKPGLTDVEFECVLPNTKDSTSIFNGGFQNAQHFLGYFEELKTSQEPFQFIVNRAMPNGNPLYNTNIKVALEDYQIAESADTGFDVRVKVNLRQWKSYGSKTVTLQTQNSVTVASATEARPAESSPAPAQQTTYTVVKGDSLWAIARRFYNSGALYTKIYEANADLFSGRSPNLIYPGDVLVIPAA